MIHTPFNFDDFDLELTPDDTVQPSQPSGDAYLDRRIAEIPERGDAARWAIAEYKHQKFDFEPARDGTLTPEQSSQVDCYIARELL